MLAARDPCLARPSAVAALDDDPLPALLADLQNTILAAILTFSDRLVYPAYASVTVGRLSALDDQALAGVIMWVPGSLVFLVAAIWLAMEALSGARAVPGVASSLDRGMVN